MKILFIGDSITDANRDRRNYHCLGDGYVRRVAEILTESFPENDFEFINMGISANRTGQLFDRIHYDAVSLAPDITVILIGINDVLRRYKKGESHIETSDEQIELNYKGILTQISKYTDSKIITMSPFFLDPKNNSSFPLDTESCDGIRRDLERLSPIIVALAKKYADAHIQLDTLFDSALKAQPYPQYYSADGVHPNSNGAELMAGICADIISKILKKEEC